MNAQEIASIGSALAAAMVAMIPVYAKWKEVWREQALADRDQGLTAPAQFQATLRSTFSAVSRDPQTLVVIALALLILGGLIHNHLLASRLRVTAETHYAEFLKIRDLVNERHAEARAMRELLIQSLQRIERRLEK